MSTIEKALPSRVWSKCIPGILLLLATLCLFTVFSGTTSPTDSYADSPAITGDPVNIASVTNKGVAQYITAEVSADKTSYIPGEQATFTVTFNNATGKDFKALFEMDKGAIKADKTASINITPQDENGNVYSDADPANKQFGNNELIVAKRANNVDGTASYVFTLTIPNNASGDFTFVADMERLGTKAFTDVTTNANNCIDTSSFTSPYVTVQVSVPTDVKVTDSSEGASQLNKPLTTGELYSTEYLEANFDLTNYQDSVNAYDYELKVEMATDAGDSYTDVTNSISELLFSDLPGTAGSLGLSGSGSMDASTASGPNVQTATVQIPTLGIDPTDEHRAFRVTLNILDAGGNVTSSRQVDIIRETPAPSEANVLSKNDAYISAKVTADKALYAPGDTATFTITLTNNTGAAYAADAGKNKWLSITPSAGQLSGFAPSSYDLKSDTIAANGGTLTKTFTVVIPDDAPGGLLPVPFELTGTGKNHAWAGSSDPLIIMTPITIDPSEDVKVVKAAAGDSHLSQPEDPNGSVYPSEYLEVNFDLTNYVQGDNDYTYKLKIERAERLGSTYEDVTPSAVSWVNLPGVSDLTAVSGEGLMSAAPSPVVPNKQTATVTASLDAIDPDDEYNAFRVTLVVTDGPNGATISAKSVEIPRYHIDLTDMDWLIRDRINGDHTFHGVAWLKNLYYANVARDPNAPFHDAEGFLSFLQSAPTEEKAQALMDEWIYDLYDPNGRAEPTSAAGSDFDYGEQINLNDSGNWKKDSTAPFHYTVDASKEDATLALAEHGVSYNEDYFDNLSKTVTPDKGDDNINREFTIDIKADAAPKPQIPSVFVFLVQTTWQMFDADHEIVDGNVRPNISTAMWLYDIKAETQAFLSKFLEKDGTSNNNFAVGFANYQHGGSYSLIETTAGSGKTAQTLVLSNNLPAVIEGLDGWDSFGDCEHPHWDKSGAFFEKVIPSIGPSLDGWNDSKTAPIVYIDPQTGKYNFDNVNINLIVLGGSAEGDGTGQNGYTAQLTSNGGDFSVFDHVYTISTISGDSDIPVRNQNGDQIYSWLDNNDNLNLVAAHDGKHYVVSPELSLSEIYDDIYSEGALFDPKYKYGVVDDATLSDTVTREFIVTGGTASWRISDSAYNPSDPSFGALDAKQTISIDWTVDSNGNIVVPDDSPFDMSLSVNANGETEVTCNYGTLHGQGTIELNIDVVAKDDFMGNNNTPTNVGTPGIDFTHDDATTGETASFHQDFTDKPSANVPLLTVDAEGGSGTNAVNHVFDLANYASFDPSMLDDGYEGTNGTLRFEWVEVDSNGNELPTQTISYTPNEYTVENGVLQGGVENVKLPSCEVTSAEVTVRHFKLKVTYAPDDATNKLIPVSPLRAEAAVTLSWSDSTSLKIVKKDSVNKAALPGASFKLYADDGDGIFNPDVDQLANVYADPLKEHQVTGALVSNTEGIVQYYGIANGTYWIYESAAAAGYERKTTPIEFVLSDGGATFDGVSKDAEEGGLEYQITIENAPLPTLPLSGDRGGIVLLFLALAMIAGSVTYFLYAGRLNANLAPSR